MKSKSKFYFSLTELVLILVTCAVVSTLFLAACSDSKKNEEELAAIDAKEKANKTRCIFNLKNVGTAILFYEIDSANSEPLFVADTINGNKNIGTKNAHAQNFEYLRKNNLLVEYKIYVCPSSDVKPNKKKDVELAGSMISYAFFVDDSGTKGVSSRNPDSVLASDGKVGAKYNHEKNTAAFAAAGGVLTYYNLDAGTALADVCASKANAEAITTIVQ